jgi:predicted nucleic acid-binding protein
VIVAELVEPEGETLLRYGLEKIELSGAQVQEVASLRDKYLRVSVNDLFALVLARALQVTLLTGDRHLSRVAKREGVPVHGTLWVLDELVGLKIVSPQEASQALNRMLAENRRLPMAECLRQLREWSKRK